LGQRLYYIAIISGMADEDFTTYYGIGKQSNETLKENYKTKKRFEDTCLKLCLESSFATVSNTS